MIDLGISNLRSVVEAFRRVGAEVEVTSECERVADASLLVLPGVGAFPDGMEALRSLELVEPVRAHVTGRERPLLGICLGMQLLADTSEEHGGAEGLGLVPGRVERLAVERPLRVPNIGWCEVRSTGVDETWPERRAFYFAHSYHLLCEDVDDVAATLEYGGSITAAVRRGRVTGVQFHPEKSQTAGLELIEALVAAESPAPR
jgi:glutamine amidotransferase